MRVFIWYIVIAFLNTAVFIGFLAGTNLPGGEIGMAPMLVIVLSAIVTAISLVIVSLINCKIKVQTWAAVLIYQIVYLIALFITIGIPVDEGFSASFRIIYQQIYYISFYISIAVLIVHELIRWFTRLKA